MATITDAPSSGTPLAGAGDPAGAAVGGRGAEPGATAGPTAGSLLPWCGAVLGVALVAATVIEPGWPVALAGTLRRLGGLWRWLAVPAALAGGALIVVRNSLTPGLCWAALRRGLAVDGAARRPLPGIAALLLGLGTAGYSAGLLSPSAVLRALFLLGIQVALYPGTPLILLLIGVAGAALICDARGERLVDRMRGLWPAAGLPAPRSLGRWAGGTWPLLSVPLAGGILAAAVFPEAMRAWGRPDGPDGQRYNFYTSFFNFSFNDTAVVERQGFDLGKRGLALKPQASGSITFQLQRAPESLVLLRANFYHRCFDGPEVCPTAAVFSNALELSTDGQTFLPVMRDTSVGEVVGDPVQDLTSLLGSSQAYWLRFRATNTSPYEVTVLPSLVVSVVVDPATVPDPLFPVVAYAAGGAVLGDLVAGWWGRPRREAFALGLTGAALLTLGAALGRMAGAALAAPPTGALDAGGGAVPLLFHAGPGPEATAAIWAARAGALTIALLGILGLLGALSRRPAWGMVTGYRRPPWLGMALLAIGLVALDARWGQLMVVRYEYLLPDAQGYQAIAAEFPKKLERYRAERYSPLLDEVYAAGFDGRASVPAVFYAGGNNGREPLWPATLRLAFNLLGLSAFHTRLTSLLCGVLVAVLTCWLGWRMLHPLAGITAGALVATNGPLVANSVHGLREELVSVCLLVMLGALFAAGTAARRGEPRAGQPRVAAAGETVGHVRAPPPDGAGPDRVGLPRSAKHRLARGGGPWGRGPCRGGDWGWPGSPGPAVILIRADMVILAGGIVTLTAVALRWRWTYWMATVAAIGVLAGPMYVGYAFTMAIRSTPGRTAQR